MRAKRKDVIKDMPEKGLPEEAILKRLEDMGAAMDKTYNGGQMSGRVFIDDSEFEELISKVVRMHITSNPLHVEEFFSTC